MKYLRKKGVKNKHNLLLTDYNATLKIKKKRKNAPDKFNLKFVTKILFLIFIILLFSFFLLFKIFKRRHNSKKINIFISFNNTNNTNNTNELNYNNNNISFEYFACFCGIARQENKYVKEFILFYINLGVENFIFGDNNLPNTEKLSDILQDYIPNGTVDIIEICNSTLGQSNFGQSIYEKYKRTCGWLLYFDLNEYLEIFFIQNETLNLQQILQNENLFYLID